MAKRRLYNRYTRNDFIYNVNVIYVDNNYWQLQQPYTTAR